MLLRALLLAAAVVVPAEAAFSAGAVRALHEEAAVRAGRALAASLVEVELILRPHGGLELEIGVVEAEDVFGVRVDGALLERHDELFADGFEHVAFDARQGVFQKEKLHWETNVCFWKSGDREGKGSWIASTCDERFSATFFGDRIRFELMEIERKRLENGTLFVKCLAHRVDIEGMEKEWSCNAKLKEELHDHAIVSNGNHFNERRNLREQRLLSSEKRKKYIKMVIVNDFQWYTIHGRNTHQISTNVVQVIQELYRQLSEMSPSHEYVIQIVRMISFSHGDPWESPTNAFGEVDQDQLLQDFARWRKLQLDANGIPLNGIAHLFSGNDFQSTVVGLANVNALCSKVAGAGVVQGKDFTTTTMGTIAAHELAHNLGAYHTDASLPGTLVPQPCQGSGFIMDPSGIRESAWSSCTVNWLEMAFSEQNYPLGCNGDSCKFRATYGVFHDKCAEIAASELFTLEPQCGNGIRESGEECDCGRDECGDADPCCDGSTCQLLPSAECSADDDCCNPATCGVRSKSENFVCRPPGDENCDLPETCDGVSPSCPFNIHQPTGTECPNSGSCYAGECISHKDQCATFFYNSDCRSANHDDGDEACQILKCSRDGATNCDNVQSGAESVIYVTDGSPCGESETGEPGDRMVCNARKCVKASTLKLPVSITCSNGQKDNGETDVDCGGPCFPCLPGEVCLLDTDCAGTSENPGRCEVDRPPTGAPTEGLTFEEPPAGFTCFSYENEEDCSEHSGCIWLEDFSKCKPTDLLPPSGSCTTQSKEASCVNWIDCRWRNNECVQISSAPTSAPTLPIEGVCSTSNLLNDDEDDDNTSNPFNDFWESIQDNLLLVIGTLAGTLLLGCAISICICRRHCCRKSRRPRPNTTSQNPSSGASDASGPSNAASFIHQSHSRPQYASPPMRNIVDFPSACPECKIHYSNPRNLRGLCNTCNNKRLQRLQELSETTRQLVLDSGGVDGQDRELQRFSQDRGHAPAQQQQEQPLPSVVLPGTASSSETPIASPLNESPSAPPAPIAERVEIDIDDL